MIKILGNGEVSKSLSLEVHAISSSAKIEKAGGEVKIIEYYYDNNYTIQSTSTPASFN